MSHAFFIRNKVLIEVMLVQRQPLYRRVAARGLISVNECIPRVHRTAVAVPGKHFRGPSDSSHLDLILLMSTFPLGLQVRRGIVERALAALLNAASAGEEARGSLFTRIQECAYPLSPFQDPSAAICQLWPCTCHAV